MYSILFSCVINSAESSLCLGSVAQWIRRRSTEPKIPGSIPGRVTWFFHYFVVGMHMVPLLLPAGSGRNCGWAADGRACHLHTMMWLPPLLLPCCCQPSPTTLPPPPACGAPAAHPWPGAPHGACAGHLSWGRRCSPAVTAPAAALGLLPPGVLPPAAQPAAARPAALPPPAAAAQPPAQPQAQAPEPAPPRPARRTAPPPAAARRAARSQAGCWRRSEPPPPPGSAPCRRSGSRAAGAGPVG